MISRIVIARGPRPVPVVDLLARVLGYPASGLCAGDVAFRCHRPHRLIARAGDVPAVVWEAVALLDRSPSWDGWTLVLASPRAVMTPAGFRSRVTLYTLPDGDPQARAIALASLIAPPLASTHPPND